MFSEEEKFSKIKIQNGKLFKALTCLTFFLFFSFKVRYIRFLFSVHMEKQKWPPVLFTELCYFVICSCVGLSVINCGIHSQQVVAPPMLGTAHFRLGTAHRSFGTVHLCSTAPLK